MSKNKIEWTDRTVNFHRGCWTGKVELLEDQIQKALRWTWPAKFFKEHGRKPRVFSSSMSDPFHEGFSAASVGRFLAMTQMRQDVEWQVLTKRSSRMRAAMESGSDEMNWMLTHLHRSGSGEWGDQCFLPNVWLGVSCENQPQADERIPELLQTSAPVRFVSFEPLLSAIDVRYPHSLYPEGPPFCCYGSDCGCFGRPIDPPLLHGIDWVIIGGESGPDARPCDLAWIRSLVEQCRSAGVPPFVKQVGSNPFFSVGCGDDPAFWPENLKHPKGGEPSEWPEDIRVRGFPR